MSEWDLLSSEVNCRVSILQTYMYLLSCSMTETVINEDFFSEYVVCNLLQATCKCGR